MLIKSAIGRRFGLGPWLSAVSCALALAGCGLMKKAPPPPPPPAPVPVSVALKVSLSADGNPDASGRASPLVVRVYALRGDDTFRRLELEDLEGHDRDKLAADLIVRDEWTLHPGETHVFRWPGAPDARHVGVIAWLRNYRTVPWHVSILIDPPGGPPAPVQSIEVGIDRVGTRVLSPSPTDK